MSAAGHEQAVTYEPYQPGPVAHLGGQRPLPALFAVADLRCRSNSPVVVNRIIDMIALYTVRSSGAGPGNRNQAAAIAPCAAASVSRSSNRCTGRVTNARNSDR